MIDSDGSPGSGRQRPLRKIVVGLIAGLAVLSAVLTIRASSYFFPSRQLTAPPVQLLVPRPGFAERLGRALQFPTFITGPAEKADRASFVALRNFLEAEFPAVHRTLEREIIAGHTLLYRWKGTDPSIEPVLLMSHLDVVPVESGTEKSWTHPPFSGQVTDGFIWGRGALDVKCGALGLLEATDRLLENGFQPAGDVYLAFGHDEETAGEGNRQAARILKERGIHFRFVLDEGGSLTEGIIDGVSGPVAFIGIAEKGYATIRLVALAEGGHSSTPPPHTAVGMVAAAVAKLESNRFPARIDGASAAMFDFLGPEMPWSRRVALANRWLIGGLIVKQLAKKPLLNALIRTTTAATVIRGGETANVLPKRAEAIVNVRLLPGDTSDEALWRVEAEVKRLGFDPTTFTCELDKGSTEATPVSSIDSDGFRTLQRTITEVYPGAIVTPGLSMVATDSRSYLPIASDIYRFLPLRITSDDMKRIHGVDERIGIKTYEEMIGFLARLIENLSAGTLGNSYDQEQG